MSEIEIPKGWHIRFNPKPIPDRNYDYDFWHDEYDVGNTLCGSAKSIEDALEQIKEIENYGLVNLTHQIIDKLALKELEIADLKRQLERLRNGKDR